MLSEVLLPVSNESTLILIVSSVYSVAGPPTFIVNLFKGQVPFGLLKLAVGIAIIC